MPNKYPGKKQSEALVRPVAKRAAHYIVQTQLITATGWVHLRRLGTRKQLVAINAASRSASYRHEKLAEETFGKPVDQITDEDIARYVQLDAS